MFRKRNFKTYFEYKTLNKSALHTSFKWHKKIFTLGRSGPFLDLDWPVL